MIYFKFFMYVGFVMINVGVALASPKKVALITQGDHTQARLLEIENLYKNAYQQQVNQTNVHNIEFKAFTWRNNPEQIEPLLIQVHKEYKPDLLFIAAPTAVKIAKKINDKLPIVFGIASDPVLTSLIEAPGKPSGNVTGYTDFENSVPGNIDFLRSTVTNKRIRSIALLSLNAESVGNLKEYESFIASVNASTANPELHIKLHLIPLEPNEPTQSVLNKLRKQQIDAVVFGNSSGFFRVRDYIAKLSQDLDIPSIVNYHGMAELGALMHRAAKMDNKEAVAIDYITRILFKGQKPSDLKVLGPNSYDMAVNETTAKKHGWVLDTKKVPGIRVVK